MTDASSAPAASDTITTDHVPSRVLHALDDAMNRKPVGRKEDQLLDAAEEIFLSHGYAGASVDDIVLKAEISKATLYKYFHDKEALFRAVIDRRCVQQREKLGALTLNLSTEEALIEGGKMAVTFMVSPLAQAVYRTCVAEAARFPHVGHAFFLSAAVAMTKQLSALFECAEEAGDLIIPDKAFAANQLWQLARSVYFYELMFQVRDNVSQHERNHVVKESLEMFVARYGTESFKPRMAKALEKLS
ncbi:TetR/AcrR family transcriptional regulator [Ahrensia marina]|uniref:TetR/AcrR family transcriptional regulator n=1 Tax=Ahrensia marina TaxID=1514904 RepID=UPI0035CF5172